MAKISLLTGFAAGYVLGSKAGRERYDQIRSKVDEFMGNPKVQDKMHQATEVASEQKDRLAGAAKGKTGSDKQGSDQSGGGTAGPRTTMGTSPASPAETSLGAARTSPRTPADGERSTTGTDTGSGPVH